MKNSVLWWDHTRQTDGHSQVHSGHERLNPPGASPDQQEPLTVAEDPVFTSRTTAFCVAAHLSKREAQIFQFLPDTPCAPNFLNLHLWIPKLDYCRGVFLAVTIARNCLYSGSSSILSLDSHCTYIHLQHLIHFSSLLFLFTGPFFILPGMQSIWECRWKTKIFQHPLIEICFIN